MGHGKLAYMEQEHDAASLAMMRTLKQALDPEGLMNPGKLIPGVWRAAYSVALTGAVGIKAATL